jgi:hypothetical protein
MQPLYNYLLPFATHVDPFMVTTYYLQQLLLAYKTYTISIAIYWQLSSCGKKMHPILEAKQRVNILSFLEKNA